ncbi:MAG: diaminopimelate epimerase [Candidatus Cloacimonetes bacterium]|nr:diaminopimelate epimerase [Candidatus Cloacimonadota bacterium]
MKLDFFKMQGQGNDYIFLNLLDKPLPGIDFPELSRRLSDRHFGIGSDGLVLILPAEQADAAMRIFNKDGSEGKNCGTALRCITAHLCSRTGKTECRITTLSGTFTSELLDAATLKTKITFPRPEILQEVHSHGFKGFLVNSGNLHFVTVTDDLQPDLPARYGSLIENDSCFPERVNVEFVNIMGQEDIKIHFWEKGSGVTLACGTGTAAAASLCYHLGLTSEKITAHTPGGLLDIIIREHELFLIGAVSLVFTGSVHI